MSIITLIKNDIIMMRLFKLKSGLQSCAEDNRIYIREFRHSIMNKD